MAIMIRIFSGDGMFPTLWEVVISLSFWFTCCLFPGASSTSRSYASSVKREGGFEWQEYIPHQVYTVPRLQPLAGRVRSSHLDFSWVWEGRASRGRKERVWYVRRRPEVLLGREHSGGEWGASQSVLPSLLWLHQHSRMLAGPLQHLPGRSLPLKGRSFSSELTSKCARRVNISVLVCWRGKEGGRERGKYVMDFLLAPYSVLIFLFQEIWVNVEGQGNLLLKALFFTQYFLFYIISSPIKAIKPHQTVPSLEQACPPFDIVIQLCYLQSSHWEYSIKLPPSKKVTPNSPNGFNKFMILSWAAFLAIFRCMRLLVGSAWKHRI